VLSRVIVPDNLESWALDVGKYAVGTAAPHAY